MNVSASRIGENRTMDEAATWLRMSRRALQDLVQRHPFYYANGRRKLFSEEHIAQLYLALREEGHSPVSELEPAYIELKAQHVRRQRSTNPIGSIYFIEGGGFVKIGFTRDFSRRLPHIKTSSPFPITVLLVVPAHTSDEKRLHKRFANARLHGEWFKLTPEIQAYIDEVRYAAP